MTPRSSAAARSDAVVALADRELVVSRVTDAPRRLAFHAWIEPEQAACWWGPQGFTTPSCEMDARPGGTFRLAMRLPQGTEHCKRGV
jgi:uncharacterized protein YndB with AHSA1/START domain